MGALGDHVNMISAAAFSPENEVGEANLFPLDDETFFALEVLIGKHFF